MLVAVVLGNRLNDDGTPTELMLKRMQLTLEMYVKFNPDKIILSGGLANKKAGRTEAQFMREYLVTVVVIIHKIFVQNQYAHPDPYIMKRGYMLVYPYRIKQYHLALK